MFPRGPLLFYDPILIPVNGEIVTKKMNTLGCATCFILQMKQIKLMDHPRIYITSREC